MTKYIFFTGGVVSSVGKGVTAAQAQRQQGSDGRGAEPGQGVEMLHQPA